MENILKFENSKFCYPGGWSIFAPPKSGLRTEMTNGGFIRVHV
jgi:hypothetical protein